MFSLFNFQSMDITLNKEFKSVHVALKEVYLTGQFIIELEEFVSWCQRHLEVQSVFITSVHPKFSEGICPQELKDMTQEKFLRSILKLRKSLISMLYLPQTFIMDLKMGALGVGAELILAADIVIGENECSIKFDHLENGLPPLVGGLSLLPHLVSPRYSRSWILSGKKVEALELLQSGLVSNTYSIHERVTAINGLLSTIKRQSPVSRIQTKRMLLENVRDQIEKALTDESIHAHCALLTQDWKKGALHEEFTDPVHLAHKLQKSAQESTLN